MTPFQRSAHAFDIIDKGTEGIHLECLLCGHTIEISPDDRQKPFVCEAIFDNHFRHHHETETGERTSTEGGLGTWTVYEWPARGEAW